MTPPVVRTDAVHIRVPASSANLGAAFDCAGLGLDLWDDITAQVSDERGFRVSVEGLGADVLPRDCSHLVARAMKIGFDALGVHPSGLDIHCVNRIPHGQGLGSSAAAIVGGLVAARALVDGGDALLSDDELLTVALALESHPDNLAGSLFGQFSVAWVDDGGSVGHVTSAVHENVRITLCIPSTIAPTDMARAALPAEIPLADAVVNIGASALLMHAVTSDPTRLYAATRDAIHQPRRRSCFASSLDVMDRLRAAAFPAVISGAGPAVLVFATPEEVAPHVTDERWQVVPMAVATHGAHVVGQ